MPSRHLRSLGLVAALAVAAGSALVHCAAPADEVTPDLSEDQITGVNNALDVDPPFLNHSVVYFVNGGGNENTYTAYDALGRVFFASFNAKF